MRTEWKLFVYLGIFMLPLGVVYAILSREEAGSLLLIAVVVAFAFIGIYLLMQSRRMDGLRPEDYDATTEQGAGEVGSFPVGSIWPFVAASGVTLMSFGIVFNGFFAIPGFAFIIAAVIGMARESAISETGHVDLDDKSNPAVSPGTGFSDQVKK